MNKTQFKHLENLTDVDLGNISLDIAILIAYVITLRKEIEELKEIVIKSGLV